MSRPVVLVTAPVQTRSGYGNHSRDVVHIRHVIKKSDNGDRSSWVVFGRRSFLPIFLYIWHQNTILRQKKIFLEFFF